MAKAEVTIRIADYDEVKDLIAQARAEVDGLHARLAAAHTVTKRLLAGWDIDGQDPDAYPELWVRAGDAFRDGHITDAERDWLTRVAADTSKDFE